MKKAAIHVSHLRAYLSALLAGSFLVFITLAQEGKRPVAPEGKRPVTLNEGKVTEAPRPNRAVSNIANLLPRRAEYSWVVVQTDVENTEVKIDGQPVSKSKDGDFRKELPANKKYTVSVSASADFLPYTDTFLLSAKQPKIIADPLKSKFAALRI